MRIIIKLLLCAVFLTAGEQIFAQNGFLDPNIDLRVSQLVRQPDGRLLVAGDFSSVGGQPRGKTARLNQNGTLDTSFQNPQIASMDTNDDVFALGLQSDGRVLVGGLFTSVGGAARAYLARLNADGSLDAGFAPAVNSPVTAIAVQPDGRILIGGYFTNVNGEARTRLARLNADGSLDATFQNPHVSDWIDTIVVQPDGKILAGGYFTAPRARLARFNADGSLDASFAPAVGQIVDIVLQPDDKIIVAGYFSTVNGAPRTGVARLNADGSLDASFQNTAIPSGNVTALGLQADGKIVVGGEFAVIAGQTRDDLARLHPDGAFDPTFQDPNVNFGGTFYSINDIAIEPDGRVLVAGDFNTVGRLSRRMVVRLNANGTLDLPAAQTLVVTKTADTSDGACDADCSLREAVAAANAIAEPSAIAFSAQLFNTPQTITLAGGELVIADNRRLSISGTGANLLTISGGNASRLFRLSRDAVVSISSLTLSGGNGAGGGLSGEGGAVYIEPNGVATELTLTNVALRNNTATVGGAIRTLGRAILTIDNSLITENAATYNPGGGGVYFNAGTLNITRTTVSNNTANFQAGGGGGISTGSSDVVFNLTDSIVTGNRATYTGGVGAGGIVTITRSTISQNEASASGAGLYAGGTVTLNDSIVTGNRVLNADGTGGGIVNYGRLTINDSVVSGNSAAFGGGIFTAGGLAASGATINDNAAENGAGIYNNAGGTTGLPVALTGCVLRRNSANGFGGGIYNRDVLTLAASSVSDNSARLGGGGAFNVFLNVGAAQLSATGSTLSGNTTNGSGGALLGQAGIINLVNTTLSGNTARGLGGGLSVNSQATAKLVNATVAFNIAVLGAGGGVSNSGSNVSALNTIFAGNGSSAAGRFSDFQGTLASDGYNLLGTTEGATIEGTTTGNVLNANPLLAPLADNGGPVRTHALAPGSPAIDAGRASAVSTDQRGAARPFDFPSVPNAPGGDGSDIGAFERRDGDARPPAAAFDFDGDGRAEIGIFRAGGANGAEWWYAKSSDALPVVLPFGLSSDKAVPADYTGDGKTDLAFWRPATGEWFVLRSEDNSFFAFPFGASGDVPVPADYDGDGRSDPAVFRPSEATWYVLKSSGGTLIRQFGALTDLPVPADYDGDGKTDFAVFRRGAGNSAEWWHERSSDGETVALVFGLATDRAVPGDFTGDGRADLALFRPSTGEWFVLRSEDRTFYSFPFGAAGDLPAPADYDGDGRADPAVFRPANGNWYVQRSLAGTLIQQFGAAGDAPLAGVFVR